MAKAPRGGVRRIKVSTLLLPTHLEQVRRTALDLGLTLADTLAYLCLKGAGMEIPPYLQEELDAGPGHPLENQRPRPPKQVPQEAMIA